MLKTVLFLMLCWATAAESFSWHTINVGADEQLLLPNQQMWCKGNASVVLDDTAIIQAPNIWFDQVNQKVTAQADGDQPVLLQYEGLTILASQVEMNGLQQRGQIRDARVHANEGLLRVGSMERTAEGGWLLHKVLYTGCEHAHPHWSFTADTASIQSSRLYTQGVVWRAGGIPLMMLPLAQLPLYRAAGTGLLLPKFSYDREQGFGLHQELFLAMGEQTDMTLGINWRLRRGAVWSHELRTALAAQGEVTVNTWYGSDSKGKLDRFTGELRKDSDYWVTATGRYELAWQNIQHQPVLFLSANYGTDKRVSDHFFTAPSDRDNWFTNVLGMRWQSSTQLWEGGVRNDIWLRNQFEPTVKTPTTTQGEELFTGRRVYQLPYVVWQTAWQAPHAQLAYTHDCFADISLVRSVQRSIVYDIVASDYIKHSEMQWIGRVGYQGCLQAWHAGPLGTLTGALMPTMLMHHEGEMRRFARCAIESGGSVTWALPQVQWYYKDSQMFCAAQPLVTYAYQPRQSRASWQVIDEKEVPCTLNQLKFGIESSWQRADLRGMLSFWQPVSLLRPTIAQASWPDYFSVRAQPLECGLHLNASWWSWQSKHQFLFRDHAFAVHDLRGSIRGARSEYECGIVYVAPEYAKTHGLFFDGGTFLVAAGRWRRGPASWWYEAQWLHRSRDTASIALQQQVGFSYEGHCWSLRAGYEEKRYVYYGRGKKQHSFFVVFSFRPMGSLGTKVKLWANE